MKVFLTIILTCLVWVFITSGASFSKSDCASIRTGKFFQYKNANQLNSIIIREDSTQYEINSAIGDTSTWKIHWTDDCTFTCAYFSGLKFSSEPETDFYNHSIIIFKIKRITDEYYCYDA